MMVRKIRASDAPRAMDRSFPADPQPGLGLRSYRSLCNMSPVTSAPSKTVPKNSAPMGSPSSRPKKHMTTECFDCGHDRNAHEHYRRSSSDSECALCNCSRFRRRSPGFFGLLAWIADHK